MFAFTKEQKQDKLARTNVDNYNKLEFSLSTVTDSLQREAISIAMADIVDIFTMLRSTYDLSKPVKTTEDYRLLRVPGMPGIVVDYKWIANELVNVCFPYYASEIATDTYQNLQEYLITALSKKKLTQIQNKYKHKSELYGIATSFSEVNFDTLLNLESILHTSRSIKVVTNNYNREICQQFAHNQNIDILISI